MAEATRGFPSRIQKDAARGRRERLEWEKREQRGQVEERPGQVEAESCWEPISATAPRQQDVADFEAQEPPEVRSSELW